MRSTTTPATGLLATALAACEANGWNPAALDSLRMELTDEFILPEDLSTLSADELAALETQAVEAFDEVRGGDLNEQALAALGQLAEAVDLLRAEGGRRSEAQAEANAAVEAMVSRIHGGDAAAEVTSEDEGDEGGEGEAGDGGSEAPAEGEQEAEGAEAGELVTASARVTTPRPRKINVPLSEVRKRAPKVDADAPTMGITITASSDLPNVVTGSRFAQLSDVAVAMHGKARQLADKGRASIATIELPVVNDARHIVGLDAMDDFLRQVTSPDVLVAAGGWCAPSMPIFDLFSIEGVDGLIDLPSITVERGGIEFPVSPSIASVFTAPWLWTEADDIAAASNVGPEDEDYGDNVTKPCFRIPCPTFDAERLDAHGLCISHGNLSDRAYPELTTRYISLVTSAHLHLISLRHIAAMVAGSTAVAIPDSGTNISGSAAPILSNLELQAIDYRLKFRMRDDAVLEGVFPAWAKGIIRADLALRQGVDLISVTDAQIMEWFDQRSVRVQFVQDWQVGTTGYPGQAAAATAWPDNIRFLLYAAGTWAEGQGGAIDLGVTRDSTQIAVNDHTAAWTEEFRLLAKIGHESRVVQVPMDPNGVTHLGVALSAVVADAP